MVEIIRLIAGGILAMICSYIGVMIKRSYKNRELFYKEASQFAGSLAAELSFKKTPMPDAVEEFVKEKQSPFTDLLRSRLTAMRMGKLRSPIDEKMLHAVRLKKEECGELEDFFNELGKASLDEELAAVRRAESRFNAKHEECAGETKRLGGMYFKLLVLLGIALIFIVA
jgi:stage III sporulation protein AB